MFLVILPSNWKKKKKEPYKNDRDACKSAVVISSCGWELVQGKSFEIKQQSRNRRGRLSNLLVPQEKEQFDGLWPVVVSSCDCISAEESKSRTVKYVWTTNFPWCPSPILLTVQMPWFHSKASVYNKMIIASFICSLFKAPSLLWRKIVLFLKQGCQQGYNTLLLPAV